MLKYPVLLEIDDDSIMVTSPDFPELSTYGLNREEALGQAIGALEEAIAGRIYDSRDIPTPSDGKETVILPTLTAIKVLLYRHLRESGIGKAELARRLGWYLPQVDRLLDVSHNSRMDQMDAAMKAIGCQIHTKTRKNSSGGAAAIGGGNFQTAVTAISYIHTLRGTPVDWIEDLTVSPPVCVSSETGGPGDDVRLELADGSIVEVQAKKGLRANSDFWSAIDSLSEGIILDRCTYGVLIVCPSSSNSIRRYYANGIRRIAESRFDSQSDEQRMVLDRLNEKKYDPTKVCARLRIRTVSAIRDQIDDIVTARAYLEHLCVKRSQVKSAWNALYADASQAIESKGRRTNSDLVSVLVVSGIKVKTHTRESPAAINQSLCHLIDSTTREFDVIGLNRPLVTNTSWLNLKVSLSDSVGYENTIEDALSNYHELSEKTAYRNEDTFDAKTIGTFHKHCVVVGGPGSGKSLLLQVLAREFASDSFVSLKVNLRDLAKQIRDNGWPIEEGLLRLGLDGYGVSPRKFRDRNVSDLVYLCDGLDECGDYQREIASGLKKIATSSSSCRIIVTTRPIGYDSRSILKDWRHYVIRPLNPDVAVDNLKALCHETLNSTHVNRDRILSEINDYVGTILGQEYLIKSPLLLSFAASLILNRRSLGQSKIELYNGVIRQIRENSVSRKNIDIEQVVLDYVLNYLGWITGISPLQSIEDIEKSSAEQLQQEFGETFLKSKSLVLDSIAYWEQTGIIERLHCDGQDLISFVHKTFGEFAAARYLEYVEISHAKKLAANNLECKDWNSVLDFFKDDQVCNAITEVIIDQVANGTTKTQLVDLGLRIVSRTGILIKPNILSAFLDRVFSFAQAEDRQEAYRIGVAITNVDLSGVVEVADRAKQLLKSQTEWSRLIGWAVLTCHFPGNLDHEQLENAVFNFIAHGKNEAFWGQPVRDGSIIDLRKELSRDQPGKEVFKRFLSNALEIVLVEQTVDRQDLLLSSVSELKGVLSINFLNQLEKLLIKIDRLDAVSLFSFSEGTKLGDDVSRGINAFNAGKTVLFQKVLAHAFANNARLKPPKTGMKHLGAFINLAAVMEDPASNMQRWTTINDFSSVHSLIKAAVKVFQLSSERLSSEVLFFYKKRDRELGFSEEINQVDMIPRVDVQEANWEGAKDVEISNALLEELVHHPVIWVKYLTSNLLHHRLEDPERFDVCGRLLKNGRGTTLYIAARLASVLPDCKGYWLIKDTLRKSPRETPKCDVHYLLDLLAEDRIPVDQSDKDIVELGLFSSSKKIAKSTANWCSSCIANSEKWLVRLLKKSFEYWRVNEQPYPKSLPDSPSGVIYEALSSIGGFEFKEVVKLVTDARHSVAEKAIQDLIKYASCSEKHRNQLVDEICNKRFSPSQCIQLLDSEVPYSTENLTKLCLLFNEIDPNFRQAAVSILSHPNIYKSEALELAINYKDDDDGNVRDAVYRYLDSIKKVGNSGGLPWEKG